MKFRAKADGSLVRVLPDGTTEAYAPGENSTWPGGAEEGAVDAAKLARMARERCGLTQAAFAVRYRLPVATVRDWEYGRRAPDAAALTLLRLIAGAPLALRRLTTRFTDAGQAVAYLLRFAEAAGSELLAAEIDMVLRYSPMPVQSLRKAAASLPEGKLKSALAAADPTS